MQQDILNQSFIREQELSKSSIQFSNVFEINTRDLEEQKHDKSDNDASKEKE